MTWQLFLNVCLTGLLTGLLYGLMALGLSAIFGVIRVVNFAHGDMLVVAMYATLLLANAAGLHPLASLPVVALGLFALGYCLQRFFVNRFLDQTEHVQFLLLLGVAMVLTNGSLMAFGPDAQSVQVPESFDSYEVGPFMVDKVRVIAAVVAGLVAAALWAFFKMTTTGKAIRACADNRLGAQVVGLNVPHLYAVTFGVGAACLGVTGALLLMMADVTPHMSTDYTLLAFIIVIVGGLGSFGGALLGGVLVGLSEAMSGFLVAPSLKTLFSFALLILILLARPQGILGKR
jgi:branched-chain amino acid transport system permease protein